LLNKQVAVVVVVVAVVVVVVIVVVVDVVLITESDETNLLQDAFSSLTVDQLSGLLKAKTGRAGRKSKADAREEEEIRKTLAKKMAGTQPQNE